MSETLSSLIRERFGESVEVSGRLERNPELTGLAAHRSHRAFTGEPVSPELLRTLLASAFSAPAKSDLQQSCVVHVSDRAVHERIAGLIPSMPWIADAPVLLVFCGDNRRIRRICELRGTAFANDHLDSFLNAAVDTGLVMAGFIRAAQAAGLGCCPLSAVRNHAAAIGEMLALPEYVFPVAGMVAGHPAKERRITPRLPLDAFVHTGRYDDGDLERWIEELRRAPARGAPAQPGPAARSGAVRARGLLRMVRGQGAPGRGERARGLRSVRALAAVPPRLNVSLRRRRRLPGNRPAVSRTPRRSGVKTRRRVRLCSG